MNRESRSDQMPLLLAGAAVGAGLALFLSEKFRKNPDYLPNNLLRKLALDRTLQRARRAGARSLDGKDRYIIFSDHHKGGRDKADDFLSCEGTYLAALDYYLRENYTLIVLGDAEELWEESIGRVLSAYPNVLEREARFHPQRYIRLSGNHDDAWENEGLVRQFLSPFFPGIRVYQELLFEYSDGLNLRGEILLIHGHQGTWDADVFDFLPPHLLPLYRQFQNLTGLGHTSPSRNVFDRSVQDNQMYYWASQQEKLLLIAGHTHRPIWSSMSHLERLMAQFHALLHMQPKPENYEAESARLQGEIKRRAKKDPPNVDAVKAKPCYFNTGCCRFKDGDITGIEIVNGDISLVKWGSVDDEIVRSELEHISLQEIFLVL